MLYHEKTIERKVTESNCSLNTRWLVGDVNRIHFPSEDFIYASATLHIRHGEIVKTDGVNLVV